MGVTVRSQASMQVRIFLAVGIAALVAIMFQSACSTQFVAYEWFFVATAVAPRGVRERCAVHGELPVSMRAAFLCYVAFQPFAFEGRVLFHLRSPACRREHAWQSIGERTSSGVSADG